MSSGLEKVIAMMVGEMYWMGSWYDMTDVFDNFLVPYVGRLV